MHIVIDNFGDAFSYIHEDGSVWGKSLSISSRYYAIDTDTMKKSWISGAILYRDFLKDCSSCNIISISSVKLVFKHIGANEILSKFGSRLHFTVDKGKLYLYDNYYERALVIDMSDTKVTINSTVISNAKVHYSRDWFFNGAYYCYKAEIENYDFTLEDEVVAQPCISSDEEPLLVVELASSEEKLIIVLDENPYCCQVTRKTAYRTEVSPINITLSQFILTMIFDGDGFSNSNK